MWDVNGVVRDTVSASVELGVNVSARQDGCKRGGCAERCAGRRWEARPGSALCMRCNYFNHKKYETKCSRVEYEGREH